MLHSAIRTYSRHQCSERYILVCHICTGKGFASFLLEDCSLILCTARPLRGHTSNRSLPLTSWTSSLQSRYPRNPERASFSGYHSIILKLQAPIPLPMPRRTIIPGKCQHSSYFRWIKPRRRMLTLKKSSNGA